MKRITPGRYDTAICYQPRLSTRVAKQHVKYDSTSDHQVAIISAARSALWDWFVFGYALYAHHGWHIDAPLQLFAAMAATVSLLQALVALARRKDES